MSRSDEFDLKMATEPKRRFSGRAFNYDTEREQRLEYIQNSDEDSDFQGMSSGEESEINGNLCNSDGDLRQVVVISCMVAFLCTNLMFLIIISPFIVSYSKTI